MKGLGLAQNTHDDTLTSITPTICILHVSVVLTSFKQLFTLLEHAT